LYAVAAQLALLERFQPGWTMRLRSRFTETTNALKPAFQHSFWAGYLSNPAIFSNVMVLLREHFRDLIEILWHGRRTHEVLNKDLQGRFAEHVAIGWLRGLEGFGLDGLLGDLARCAPDQALATVAWYTGKQLQAVNRVDDDRYEQLWAQLKAYWEFRTALLSDSIASDSESRREADRLVGWLTHIRTTPSSVYEPLRTSIKLVSIGWSLNAATDFLLKHATSDTSAVTDLASAIAQRWAAKPTVVWDSEGYKELLEQIARIGTKSNHHTLKEIVSLLLAAGKADYRSVVAQVPEKYN